MTLRRITTLSFALGLALSLGAISACFNPPADDVMFACASGGEPACPSGYTCEMDLCCHKDGSDVDANLGGCALGLGGDGSESGGPADESTESDSSDEG